MAEDHPETVFIADNGKVAEAVVQLLASHNITAEAFTENAQTSTEVITGMSEIVPAEKFEIRVYNQAQAADARELLSRAVNATMIQMVQEKRSQRTGTVAAVCEECGKSSEWPADTMGTVATCPHCGQYMDIPDPDDDWSGVDFGKDEDEE